jgi:hypothetical protein
MLKPGGVVLGVAMLFSFKVLKAVYSNKCTIINQTMKKQTAGIAIQN